MDLKGCSGALSTALLQDRTMLRISLGITRRLALQALQADPASYRECGEIMRRVWGIIIVAGRWQVFLMYAALDEGGERRREQGEMEERWSRSEGGTGLKEDMPPKKQIDWRSRWTGVSWLSIGMTT